MSSKLYEAKGNIWQFEITLKAGAICLIAALVLTATIVPLLAAWLLISPVSALHLLQHQLPVLVGCFAVGLIGFLAWPVGLFGGISIPIKSKAGACFWLLYPILAALSHWRFTSVGLPPLDAVPLSIYCSLAIPTGLAGLFLLVCLAMFSYTGLKK